MTKHSLWTCGFRPFFMLGSLVGGLLVSYWAIAFHSGRMPEGYFEPVIWHAHEMIYGFAVAIVAGFLLTASPKWTNSKPLSGFKLAIIFYVWLAGRIGLVLSFYELPIPEVAYFIIDIMFIPCLIGVLAPPLLAARQLKNIQFLLVLSLLTLGNFLIHLSALGLIESICATKAIYLGVNLILFVLVIISGRVVPLFTTSSIPGYKIRKVKFLDTAIMASVCSYIVVDFISEDGFYAAWIAFVASILHFIRLLGWQFWKTWRNPLIWILHLGYFWIVIGFFLIFLSEIFSLLPRSVAMHSFTAGAMGTFIIAMMSRVSLGHTGRAIKLAKGFVLSYYLVTFSAAVRVGSVFVSDFYTQGILIAGTLWGLSLFLFTVYYSSILVGKHFNSGS